MSETICAIAADTKIETPEGPLTIKTLSTAPASVLTRTDDGQVRFAMMRDVRKTGEGQPVVRVTLDNGLSFRAGVDQVLLKKGADGVRAGDLQAGDELEPLFSFPDGYVAKTDDGRELASRASVVVTAVVPAGDADVYSFRVNRTGRFLLSAGVLAKAEAD